MYILSLLSGDYRQREAAAKLHHLTGHAVLTMVLFVLVDFSRGRQKLQRVDLRESADGHLASALDQPSNPGCDHELR